MIDLAKAPPRRWSDAVDGIFWLPRLIDKARAYEAGTLGDYFFGQSPVDGSFLKAAGVGYADIIAAVRAAPDDAGVLAFIETRAPGATQRLRAWCANPPPVAKFTFGLIDADEGRTPGPAASLVRALPIGVLARLYRALRGRPTKD
jgi:hypothetical protein